MPALKGAFVLVCSFATLGCLLCWFRIRLYARHAETFSRTDTAPIRDKWRELLRRQHQAMFSVILLNAGYVLVAYLLAFGARIRRDAAEFLMGALVFLCLTLFCREAYFLFNRIIALANPPAATRAARRFPRSGIALEALVILFVMMPVAVGWYLTREMWLLGGMAGVGMLLVVRLVQLLPAIARPTTHS
jgi:hypothetical protein